MHTSHHKNDCLDIPLSRPATKRPFFRELLGPAALALLLLHGWFEAHGQSMVAGDIYAFAGTGVAGQTGNGGAALSAEVSPGQPLVMDKAGDIYYVDSTQTTVYVRKVTPAGIISLFATLPSGSYALGMAIDANGNVYVTDFNAAALTAAVYKITPQGTMTIYAGNGHAGTTVSGVQATATSLGQPSSLAMDAAGDLFIGDFNVARVFEVSPSGIIVFYAGTGTYGYSGDKGSRLSANIQSPTAMCVDPLGNLYMAMNGPVNSSTIIRKISPQGTINLVAGNILAGPGYSGDGGPAINAQMEQIVYALAADAAGNLFISDTFNYVIRRVAPNGYIYTAAGSGSSNGYNSNGTPALKANFALPGGLAINSAGSVFVGDGWGYRIWELYQLDPPVYPLPTACYVSGTICTYAGGGASTPTIPNGVPAVGAYLAQVKGMVIEPSGALFYVDQDSDIQEVNPSGLLVTYESYPALYALAFPGSPCNPLLGDVRRHLFAKPDLYACGGFDLTGIALDPSQNLSVVGDYLPLLVIAPSGAGTPILNGSCGTAACDLQSYVTGLAANGSGNFYVAAPSAGVIDLVTGSTKTITTFAGGGTSTANGVPATSASIPTLNGIALDTSGNLYYATATAVREVSAATGLVNTIAGNGQSGFSGDGGNPLNAGMSPTFITVNSAGNVFLFDGSTCVVRVIAAGIIKTIAGDGGCGLTGDGGPALSATLQSGPIAVDSSGNLFISNGVNSIRRIATPSLPQSLPASHTMANAAYTGSGVIMDAAVTGGGAQPTGTVTFSYQTTPTSPSIPLATVPLTGNVAVYTAVFAAGTYYITEAYNGSATYGPSSGTVPVTVP